MVRMVRMVTMVRMVRMVGIFYEVRLSHMFSDITEAQQAAVWQH